MGYISVFQFSDTVLPQNLLFSQITLRRKPKLERGEKWAVKCVSLFLSRRAQNGTRTRRTRIV